MFAVDGIAYTVCRYVYNFLIMSALFLLTCIPIVTIPAGIAALCGVAREQQRDDSQGLLRPFWRLFKENFVNATLSGWTLAAFGAFLSIDARLTDYVHSVIDLPITIALWFLLIAEISVSLHIFPLMVHVKSSYRDLFLSALKLSIYRVHLTVANLLVLVIAGAIAFHFSLTLLLLFPGVAAYVTYWFVNQKFRSIAALESQRQVT